jgi:hypothetical protein
MSFKITGLDEVKNKLKKITDAAQALDGEQVSIPELLTDSFIKTHTNLKSAQELFDQSGFKIDSPDDFKAIPDEEWDKYIASVSGFNNWKEMLKSATAEYLKRKMGL